MLQGLPAKASLYVKSLFSGTGIIICLLLCTRFPETNMLLFQKLHQKIGNNFCRKRVPIYSNLVYTNDQILLPVLENDFLFGGSPWQTIPVKNGTKTTQYLIKLEVILED